MSRTRRARQAGPGNLRIIGEHHVADPHDQDESKPPMTADGAGISCDRNPLAAPTCGDSTPHGGWRWGGSSWLPWRFLRSRGGEMSALKTIFDGSAP